MESIRFFQFNTLCEVVIHDTHPGARDILAAVKQDAEIVRRLLDFYDPDSELGRLNQRHVPGEPFTVSEALFGILRDMLAFSAISGGRFDPTVAPLVRLWAFTAQSPAPPGVKARAQMLAQCGAEHIGLDETARTITFERVGMALDAGGAGKGYAVDRAVGLLRKAGVRGASVDYGGNLYLLGAREDRPWRIGVQAPFAPRGESLDMLKVQDRAVSTSGVYERCFTSGGQLYHHLLDPKSGLPAETGLAAVTVTCESALWADMLSTACFIAGADAIPDIIARLPGAAEWLAVSASGVIQSNRQQTNRKVG